MASTPKIMGLPVAITLTCLVNNYVAPWNGYGNDTRISWKHHGNIMGVSWQWHWEHGNIMYPSERQYSVSVWFPGGWWWCSLWWVNDQPSNAMPCWNFAQVIRNSPWLYEGSSIPSLYSCLSLYIVHCNCRRFCHSCNVQWKEQNWVHEIVDTTHYVACLFLAPLMGDSGNSQQQDTKSGIL